MKVQNKAIVVTGGANGIGRELALRLLDKGARVAAVGINEAGLQETAALASGKTERLSLHMANISSMGGLLPVPGQGIYGASKAAVKLMAEALHSELSNTNVKVTVIFPGAIGMNIAANSGVGHTLDVPSDAQRQSIKPLAPSKAAEIMVDGIEKDEYEILVGRDSALMSFLYRFSSRRAARFISKQMQSLLPN